MIKWNLFDFFSFSPSHPSTRPPPRERLVVTSVVRDEREGVLPAPAIIFTRVCGKSYGRKIDPMTFVCVTGNNPSGARLAIRVLQTTPICCFVGHCLGMKLVRAHTRRSQEQ